MANTIAELLSEDLGVTEQPSQEKVASQETQESDSIEKLAMEIGLVEDNNEQPTPEPEKTETTGQSKEAQMSMNSLYNTMFPEEVATSTKEKTASQEKSAEEKVAAEKEEAMGVLAFDSFAQHIDSGLAKIAEELTGDATISTEAGAVEPAQTMADNKPADATPDKPIDTTPQVTDIVTAQKGSEVVGTEEQKPAPDGESRGEKKEAALKKSAALKKMMLLSQLDDEEGRE